MKRSTKPRRRPAAGAGDKAALALDAGTRALVRYAEESLGRALQSVCLGAFDGAARWFRWAELDAGAALELATMWRARRQ